MLFVLTDSALCAALRKENKMKKLTALLLALVLVLALAACNKTPDETKPSETPAPTETKAPETEPQTTAPTEPTTAPTEPTTAPTEPAKDPFEKSEGVMTYAQYMAAEKDDPVTIEAFIQAKQYFWTGSEPNNTSLYLADPDGAYFCYQLPCTQAEFDAMTIGSKIRVTGYKTFYKDLPEVDKREAAFELVDDGSSYIVDTKDLTEVFENWDPFDYVCQKFSATAVIAPIGEGQAFLYNYNGAGSRGSDLYFNVSFGEKTYQFLVESSLCNQDTEVYAAVEALKVGDVVDMEGFLYWYNGPNPHITSVSVKGNVSDKSEGVMTYAQYMAAEKDDPVTIEAYIQAKQYFWTNSEPNNTSLYLADPDGAYFCYQLPCTQADFDAMTIGSKIRVTGYKTFYKDLPEVDKRDATFELVDDGVRYIADTKDLTDVFANGEPFDYVGQKFCATAVIAPIGENQAFLYNYNGAGSRGSDLYFNVSIGEKTYQFLVESSLCNQDTEVYAAVEALKVGDTVELEGFLYWYNGVNPHITSVTVK